MRVSQCIIEMKVLLWQLKNSTKPKSSPLSQCRQQFLLTHRNILSLYNVLIWLPFWPLLKRLLKPDILDSQLRLQNTLNRILTICQIASHTSQLLLESTKLHYMTHFIWTRLTSLLPSLCYAFGGCVLWQEFNSLSVTLWRKSLHTQNWTYHWEKISLELGKTVDRSKALWS